MLCENCKQNVATSYCQIKIDNKVVQKYLCQSCRSALVKDNELSVNPEFKIKNQFCRNCGTTLKDFVASSYVGCECCYDEFSAIIEQALKSVQTGSMHQGKVPERFVKKQEILNLEQVLEKAMQNGDLTQINRLNAKLKQLKGGGNG